jgi:6-phosphogluconolactonase (cycloisomerase 2 family)
MEVTDIEYKSSIADSYTTRIYRVVMSSDNNYAYVTCSHESHSEIGYAFLVIDISDKANAVVIGSYYSSGAGDAYSMGTARGVAQAGDYAYVGTDSHLVIIDLSTKTNPTVIGSCATDPIEAIKISSDENYAYCITRQSGTVGFYVIDISTKSSPSVSGSVNRSGNMLDDPRGMAVSGDHVYIAAYTSDSLTVIDISTPSAPSKVGHISGVANKLNGATDVVISGTYAYVTGRLSDAVVVIDISTPTSLSKVGQYYEEAPNDDIDAPSGIVVSGDFLYVASYNYDAIFVFDISTATSPAYVPEYEASETYLDKVESIDVQSNYLCAAAYGVDTFSIYKVIMKLDAPTASITVLGPTAKVEWTAPLIGDIKLYWIDSDNITGVDEEDPDDLLTICNSIDNLSGTYYIFDPYIHTGTSGFGKTYYFVVVASGNDDYTTSGGSNIVTAAIASDGSYDDLYLGVGQQLTGGKPMKQMHSELTYRLNIAKDVHARTEQIRFWSDEEILRSINEGYLDFVRRTECLWKFDVIPIVADQTEYDLPSDCIRLLWIGDDTKNLVGQSLAYMDQLDDSWIGRSGDAAYFVSELNGIKTINLYQTPETAGGASFTADTNHSEADADHGLLVGAADAGTALTFTADSNHSEADADHGIILAGTGESILFSGEKTTGIISKMDQHDANFFILYAYEPPEFNNLQEAQTPLFLKAYHVAIVHFSLSELYLKEGDTQNIPLADFYRMLYEDAVKHKLETRHVSNLRIATAGHAVRAHAPWGPYLPLDQYPMRGDY